MGGCLARIAGIVTIIGLILLVAATGAVAVLLNGYIALTQQTVVAEVIMEPIQQDEMGSYINITFTQYNLPTALETVIGQGDSVPLVGESQTFKVHGDTVAIRGPLIALQPMIQSIGYQNIYKLSLIEGEYRFPGETQKEGDEILINSGFESLWWDVNTMESTAPYNMVIKRVTISGDEEPGFTGTGTKRYQIVMTMDSITWNLIADNSSG